MIKERQRAILELLIERKKATVKELAAALYISEPSIRRDLARLEQQQLIKRVHGGAILDETIWHQFCHGGRHRYHPRV